MHLHTLDFLVLALYLLGSLLIGIYFSRKQTSLEAYFLGDRQVTWWLAGISVVATLLSSLSYLSVPGEVIKNGLGWFSSLLAFILIVPVLIWWVIPFLARLPVTSIYEYLGKRYGVRTRTVAATAFIVSRFIWTGLILYTVSFGVAAMTGWSIPAIILVVGIVTTFYTTAGGFKAVVWSDFVQFIILLMGVLLIPIYIGLRTGTGLLGWWDAFSELGHADMAVFSFDPTVRTTMVGSILMMFIWNVCVNGSDQMAAQRYLSTTSAQSAKKSVLTFAIGNVLIVVLLIICGIALFFFYFQQSNLPLEQFKLTALARADQMLPEFIAKELPAGLSGLLLAALLAAGMSSMSSTINSVATVAVADLAEGVEWLKRLGSSLFQAVLAAVLAGVGGILTSLGIHQFMQSGEWNLLELMVRGNHLFVAPMGVLFLAGILFPHVGGRAALAGFFAGVATAVSVSFSKEMFALQEGMSFMWIMPSSLVVSLGVSYLCGFFFAPPSESQLANLTREDVKSPADD